MFGLPVSKYALKYSYSKLNFFYLRLFDLYIGPEYVNFYKFELNYLFQIMNMKTLSTKYLCILSWFKQQSSILHIYEPNIRMLFSYGDNILPKWYLLNGFSIIFFSIITFYCNYKDAHRVYAMGGQGKIWPTMQRFKQCYLNP